MPIPRYDDIVRTAGWAGSARVAGRRRVAPPKPRAAYGKRARPARRRPAADGGRSQHYCGSLECGLPLVALWQQKTNAKCWRVHACTRSMPGSSSQQTKRSAVACRGTARRRVSHSSVSLVLAIFNVCIKLKVPSFIRCKDWKEIPN